MKLWLGVLLLTLVLTAMLVEGEESEEVGSRPKREDICRRLYPGSCKKRDKLAEEADISSEDLRRATPLPGTCRLFRGKGWTRECWQRRTLADADDISSQVSIRKHSTCMG